MTIRRSALQLSGPVLPPFDHPLFHDVPRAEIERALELEMRRGYRRGMFLFVEGEPVEAFYCILGGRVKSYTTGQDGRQQILGMYGAGQLLPLVAAFAGQRYTATAEVVRDSVVLRIPAAAFRELLTGQPRLLQSYTALLEREIVQLKDVVRNLALYSVPQRVARVLRQEAMEHGEKQGEGYRFQFSWTQQDLAHLVGTTRESVSRTLAEFRRSGVLRPGGGGHVFLDLDKLKPYLL